MSVEVFISLDLFGIPCPLTLLLYISHLAAIAHAAE